MSQVRSNRVRPVAALAGALLAWGLNLPGAMAAERVKVGLMTTLSGPGGTIGEEIRDGFQLFVRLNGSRLGGLPADIIIADDQASPEVGKQIADRMLKRDRIDVMTGIVFSNVLLPVLPDLIEARTFYVSPNTGPQDYAG